jgi:hypothetical protein
MGRNLARMDGCEPAKILTFCKLQERKSRGRPKVRWLDSVEKISKYLMSVNCQQKALEIEF